MALTIKYEKLKIVVWYMWSYIYRRCVGGTKICGVIYMEDMWGKQKYM